MRCLTQYGVPTPKSIAAHTPEEAYDVAKNWGRFRPAPYIVDKLTQYTGSDEYVIKAQVLAGGRGKGHFDTGFKGGVHLIKGSVNVVRVAARRSR